MTTYIELGGGDGPLYHPNYDARPIANVDKVVDLSRGLPDLADFSVDGIFTSHFLEHIDRASAERLLKDCYRVLKVGGWIKIIVPDMRYIVKVYTENGLTFRLYELLYGQQKHAFDYHMNVFDFQSLSKLLTHVGFSRVTPFERNPDEVCVVASK
jgi:predicted SAM-dependent methyltransferase